MDSIMTESDFEEFMINAAKQQEEEDAPTALTNFVELNNGAARLE